MTTMNVSLSEELRAFVDEQVTEHAYVSTSEYVRHLIRQDRARAKLRALVDEGLASGPAEPLEDGFFEAMRRRATEGGAG